MSTDPIAVPESHTSGASLLLHEESKHALYTGLQREVALVAGIQAMALRSIESGEPVPMEHIAELAALMFEGLNQLSSFILQLPTNQD